MKVRNIRSPSHAVALVDVDTELTAIKNLPPGIRASADGKLRTRLLEVLVFEKENWSVIAMFNVDVKTP
jgi:hypothetical protein